MQQDIETEQEKEFRKGAREVREFEKAMAELIRFEPFKAYWKWLNNQIDSRAQSLFEPLDEHPNAAARQEFDKGALKGLILARDIPSVTVQTMTQEPVSSEEE